MSQNIGKWAGSVKNDVGDQNYLNQQLHESRIHPNSNKKYTQFLKGMFQKEYGYNILKEGVPYLATVLKVLSGKNAKDSASTEGKNTKTVNPLNWADNITMPKKGDKKEKVRVIARIPEFDTGLNWPMDEEDFIRICSHGEYHAQSNSIELDDADVGDLVWVNLRGPTTSPPDGRAAGFIVGLFRKVPFSETILKTLPSPKVTFKKICKSKRTTSGTDTEFLVGKTEKNPNKAYSKIEKYKSKIKTGFYGNGTPQTKHHFNAALTNTSAMKSFKHEIPGPAPGRDNAFIWVGHLRNNGYLDLLDRPISLGRETIIYAPMTLDVKSPIELKYYFHDRAGFGHAWIHGPDTKTQQSIETVATPGNDFREKIAPAIKDMIREGRNFILVIPEMAFSRGFSTKSSNATRTKKMARGEKVKFLPAYAEKEGTKVLRTRISTAPAQAAVKDYLMNLPAGRIIFDEGVFSDDEIAIDNVLQKTHLRERETVTFDGSYTGGLFGNFHSEVLEIINIHLGVSAKNSVNAGNSSIVADGLGAINLAALFSNFQGATSQQTAKKNFKSVPISRIDYIESSKDIEQQYNFSNIPPFTIYEDYIKYKLGGSGYFEFNYITEKNSSHGGAFFSQLDKFQLFNGSNDQAEVKGSRKFSLNAATLTEVTDDMAESQTLINMHVVPAAPAGSTKNKVGYSFSMQSDLQNSPDILYTPDSNVYLTPSNDYVPDHAAAASQRSSPGMSNQYKTDIDNLIVDLNNFRNVLKSLNNYSSFCENYSGYCQGASTPDWSGKLKEPFKQYLYNLEMLYYTDTLLQHELNISKIINDRGQLQKYLNDAPGNIEQKLKDIKSNNSNKEYFATLYPSQVFSINIDETGAQFNLNEARKRLLSAPHRTVMPTNSEKISFFLEDQEFTVMLTEQGINNLGVYANIAYHIGQETALESIKLKINDALENIDPKSSEAVDPECEPAPVTLRDIKSVVPSPFINNPNVSGKLKGCAGKKIRVASNFLELRGLIDWDLPIQEWEDATKNKQYIEKTTDIKNKTPGYETKKFNYKTRGSSISVYRESPPVWSCIADKLQDSWEAACNISNYIPFRITSGIAGAESAGGVTAYNNGIFIDSYGLSINIDPMLTGYGLRGRPVYSVFTGMWTPGFIENAAQELYDLGVLYFDPGTLGFGPWAAAGGGSGGGGSYYGRRHARNRPSLEGPFIDNAYSSGYYHETNLLAIQSDDPLAGQIPSVDVTMPEDEDQLVPSFSEIDFGPTADSEGGFTLQQKLVDPQRRLAEDWADAPDSYAGIDNDKVEEYDQIMQSAANSPIVEPNSNPVEWLLTFCERSGMKWGNSLFLKKRFRGESQIWTVSEQNRIAALYGVNDIVARINAISWPLTTVDKHMHFQYYSGGPIITWNEIKGL
jgi:hypothetical protein